ncbi:MAG: transketolase [Candidatus Pacebacteria bacterium]|nr:transketolase [Candidatus Paceibacterota bacterium]MCD8508102.1 transketolase [Candidatus Paceibacterota bacterium]MCD8528094.1 transketolase [Candidatus Paceibacterota bacterium]MCD8563737.1 transketolase [Candidatus Paceibacterota bacterium]
MQLTEKQKRNLELQAIEVRQSIIDMLEDAGSGHTAGSLDMADIFTALYFHVAKHDPKNPEWPERDRIILSNGHIVPVRYATMAHAGYFPIQELKTLRTFGSRLQGHPERTHLPGLETTSGPLGSGLSQAAGMAYAAKMDKRNHHIFCLMSDGEMQAGNIWEAAMFAHAHALDNLIGIVDRNYIQINGRTEDVMPIEPFAEKWESFGWRVIEINGHRMDAIVEACEAAKAHTGSPVVIIAHTIPGKGVPEIEFDHEWHGKAPSQEQQDRWLKDLRTLKGKMSASHYE